MYSYPTGESLDGLITHTYRRLSTDLIDPERAHGRIE